MPNSAKPISGSVDVDVRCIAIEVDLPTHSVSMTFVENVSINPKKYLAAATDNDAVSLMEKYAKQIVDAMKNHTPFISINTSGMIIIK
jgi:hypothetical protein